MRKVLPTMFFLLMFSSIFPFARSTDGENNVWTVDNDGPADFSTIQEAVNAAEDGDTIFVKNGTYFENVVVNKSLSIIGESINETILDGGGGTGFYIISGGVNITCFTIRNSSYGVWLDYAQNCLLQRNKFVNNTKGIGGDNCVSCTISNNVFEGNELGMRLTSFVEFEISQNIVRHNTYGFSLVNGFNTKVHGNRVENNTDFGFHLQKFRLSVIYENNVKENKYGFHLRFTWNNDFYHNNVVNNDIQAIFVVYGSKPNRWDKNSEGNYWSDYNGTDSNRDGIGDSAYVIAEDNSDDFPLMNPYWNPADINHDLKVNCEDISISANAFGAIPGSPNWNPHADITGKTMLVPDGKVDMRDIGLIAKNYGQTYVAK